jgi:putative oxidoreductase
MTDRVRIQSLAGGVLRIVAGAMFACHGAQKILGVLTTPDHQPPVGSQLWIGGLIELVGGILITLGLFTRPAALLASGTMAVAYFQFHWQVQHAGALSERLLPIVNKGEPAVLYCFVFLMFALSGAGAYSLDARRGRG